jgi:hypothetical protein
MSKTKGKKCKSDKFANRIPEGKYVKKNYNNLDLFLNLSGFQKATIQNLVTHRNWPRPDKSALYDP